MKTPTIRQSVTFKVKSHDVYEALMDSRKHAKFSGEKASISRKGGGKFTCYGGYIAGINPETSSRIRRLSSHGAGAIGRMAIIRRSPSLL
ncbi:MAG: hypothetical protein ACLP9S_16040 [Syntrophales bacterium]|jgi:hypothetical protein